MCACVSADFAIVIVFQEFNYAWMLKNRMRKVKDKVAMMDHKHACRPFHDDVSTVQIEIKRNIIPRYVNKPMQYIAIFTPVKVMIFR